ncbi:MAG: SDR family oxidoreductase [Chloroflexota bacterium]
MNALNNKTALVTGGSKGLGRGIVQALAFEGVNVWAMARNAENLDQLKHDVKGVQTLAADVTNPQTASQSLRDIRPDILVLNAGAELIVKPIQEQSWEDFNCAWETDMKATFYFGREALLTPLLPGSVVVVVSSGAAYGGTALSGSHAGAKRSQWFFAKHLQQAANKLNLGIRFMVLIPNQVIGTTDFGRKAAKAYAAYEGVTEQAYLERYGVPFLTPEMVGQGVVSLLKDAQYKDGLAFGVSSKELAAVN